MTPTPDTTAFRKEIEAVLRSWRDLGLPPRRRLMDQLEALEKKRRSLGVATLWLDRPTLATATLDDGWGHGIGVIEGCARAVGMRIVSLGLLRKPREIIDACLEMHPDLLGLTILQEESEPDLKAICDVLSSEIPVIAGGPLFSLDPDLAGRTGVSFSAKNVSEFLHFLLFDWKPGPGRRKVRESQLEDVHRGP